LAFLTGIFIAVDRLWAIIEDDRFTSLQDNISLDIDGLLRLAIAAMSGFLFAVTYRYIIRNDDNSHLKDGAVLAFGIVRCLALWEGNSHWQEEFYSLTILSGESIFGFALVRFCLDWLIFKGCLKQ
jgi:hypothetical protein